MTTRRKFIKTVTVGTVAFSAAGTMKAFEPCSYSPGCPAVPSLPNAPARSPSAGKWSSSFDEGKSSLELSNGVVLMDYNLSFVSEGEAWSISASRDGVPDRFALVDPKGNVQGYWVINNEGNTLEILFYHRSAQNFSGTFTLEGQVRFLKDSFACRTQAGKDENVLNLSCGNTGCAHCDSLFSPESDLLLNFRASSLEISDRQNGTFDVRMSGCIDSAAESSLRITLTENWFRNRYMPYYKSLSLKKEHKVPTGWMSWNTYFDTATAEDNLAEARIGKKYLQPFGCDIWHIESWQEGSDKLPVSKFSNMNLEVNVNQFPEGMKKMAADIRALGFTPGLWVAPFGTGSETFYNGHKGWFLHDKEGRPISCWNGRYTLDPTVPAAREHIRDIFHTAAEDWGYGYFKVDGMSGRNQSYCAHLYERPEIRARFHDPLCPNPFELVLKAIREGIGEDRYLLACQGHSTGPESAYADASRLGADIVHPNRPVEWGGVMNQARCFLNQAFAHNITMICDPDTLLVKDLGIEQARVSATVIALPGQLTFFGDKLNGLDEGRMRILQQTLPAVRVRPVSLYPYFKMLPVWNLGVNNGHLPAYNVVALFNWSDCVQKVSTCCEELGIPSARMETLEFWTGQAGTLEEGGRLEAEVPTRGVRVFALHRSLDCPQWIGSDRHVSMSGVEISSCRWENLCLEMDLDTVAGFPLTEHFHIPGGYRLAGLDCLGAEVSDTLENGHLTVKLEGRKTGKTHLEIAFKLFK